MGVDSDVEPLGGAFEEIVWKQGLSGAKFYQRRVLVDQAWLTWFDELTGEADDMAPTDASHSHGSIPLLDVYQVRVLGRGPSEWTREEGESWGDFAPSVVGAVIYLQTPGHRFVFVHEDQARGEQWADRLRTTVEALRRGTVPNDALVRRYAETMAPLQPHRWRQPTSAEASVLSLCGLNGYGVRKNGIMSKRGGTLVQVPQTALEHAELPPPLKQD